MGRLMKIAICITVFSTLIFISCVNETEDTLSLESPTATLRTFVEAHNSSDLKLMATTLTDDFHFYFAPDDIGKEVHKDGYIIPTSFNRDEFLQAYQNLFNSVYSIELIIPELEGGLGEPTHNKFTCETTFKLNIMVNSNYGYQNNGCVEWLFELCGDGLWRISVIESDEWHDTLEEYISDIT